MSLEVRLSTIGTLLVLLVATAPQTAGAIACDAVERRVEGRGPAAARALWRELGLASRLFSDDEAAAILTVSRHEPGLPGDVPYLVFSILDRDRLDWQYLVFARRDDDCRLIGAVDAGGQRFEPPRYRMAWLPDGRAALVVRALERGATGLALYRETWYRLDDRRLTPVLRYPVRGYIEGWPSAFDRDLSVRVSTRERAGRTEEVAVELTSSYTTGSYVYWRSVEPLFTVSRTARYLWDRSARRFVIDLVRSELDDEEMETILDDAEEAFLKRYVTELARLAAEGTDGQRGWLAELLDALPESVEKAAVKAKLK